MFEELIPNVFFLKSQHYSCNVFLLLGEKITLIDSGLHENEMNLRNSLKLLELSTRDIQLILHSHGHADHFVADEIFEKAIIRMHEFDAKKIIKKDSSFTSSAAFGESFYPKIDSYFKEGEEINLGEFKLKVIFTPGHTAGSTSFYEKKHKLLFSGDTLFNGGIGRTDLPSGSQKDLKNSLEKLKKLKIELLLPGHGEILKGEKENQENLEKMLKLV